MQATQALWGATLALARNSALRPADTAAAAASSLALPLKNGNQPALDNNLPSAPRVGEMAQNWTAITNNGIPIITWRGPGMPDIPAPNGALCNSTSGHLFIMSSNAWHRIW